jgi:rhodanese-related sulfurtransferase
VVSALEQKGGFDNLYNLRGGIEGWAREVAPEMEIG